MGIIYFVGEFEWMKNENLKTFILENNNIHPTIKSKIIFGIASTMKSLHDINILYRNIILENILLDENFEPKLVIPFNSEILNHSAVKNTQNLTSAHKMISNIVSYQVDVYFFGLVLKDILIGRLNIFNANRSQIPDKYYEIIDKCLEFNSINRISFYEIVDLLKSDRFVIEENCVKTDLNELHEYQKSLEEGEMSTITDRFSL